MQNTFDPDSDQLVDLIGTLLAAGGPRTLPARIHWPLDHTLAWLRAESLKIDALRATRSGIELELSSDSGTTAIGSVEALRRLRARGILKPIGNLRSAAFVVDPTELMPYRRRLMTMTPEDAHLVNRAARKWTASVSKLLQIGNRGSTRAAAL